jgi:hypothetical protein
MDTSAKTPSPVQLVASGGRLYASLDYMKEHNPTDYAMYLKMFPDGLTILTRVYDAGDCDTIRWPNPDLENLRGALFDAREQGFIPDLGVVKLPDGSEFKID